MPAIVALAVLFAVVPCAVLRRIGAGDATVALFAFAWTAIVLATAHRFVTGTVLVWRGSGRIPGLVRSVRERLEPGEAVLGDGLVVAVVPGVLVLAVTAASAAEHAELAGAPVPHTTRVVGGRTGYVWEHYTTNGTWYFTAWFPQPVHTVRLECLARSRQPRFERLCGEAVRSLAFAP